MEDLEAVFLLFREVRALGSGDGGGIAACRDLGVSSVFAWRGLIDLTGNGVLGLVWWLLTVICQVHGIFFRLLLPEGGHCDI